MPSELITVQVGQCGNQLAGRFWELALREHAAHNTDGLFDEGMSSIFRNVDSWHDPPRDLPVRPDKLLPIIDLKARAVVVDMEEGVVNSLLKGPLGELFDTRQLLTDVSGSGNNWAHGHSLYGPQYAEGLAECVRTQVEACDSLQGFMLMHSLGGGTGSGLGSFILEQLADHYPNALRFATSVFPSRDDDVVTSPYNALLSLSRLAHHADCVLPLENQALLDISSAVETQGRRGQTRAGSAVTGPDKRGAKPYDGMNGVAANMLLHLTSSTRFGGPLNMDLREISTNLVPFPRQHFLLSSIAPLAAPRDVGRLAVAPRALDQVFSDAFQNSYHLIDAAPRQHACLACGLLARGPVVPDDLNRNICRLKAQIRMAPWAEDCFKTGICSKPPVGLPFSLLCLANNCAIGGTIGAMQQRFLKLYRKRLYTHHYLQYEEESVFEEALETAAGLVEAYHSLDVGGASAGSSGSSRSSNSSSRGGAVLARGPTTQGGSSSGGGSGGGSNGSGGSRGLGRPSPVGRRQAQALRGRSSLGQGDLGRGAA